MADTEKDLTKKREWKAGARTALLLFLELIFLGLVLLGVAAIYPPAAVVLAGLTGVFIVEREASKS